MHQVSPSLIKHEINIRVVKPPGTDCHIFVGLYRAGTNDPVVRIEGRDIGVKSFLDGGYRPPGCYPIYRTSCSVGRYCVNPAHNSIHRYEPVEVVKGWWAKAKERRKAAAARRPVPIAPR